MERLVKFVVLGQEYPLYTDAHEEDVREILQLVKSQLESNAHSSTRMLPANKLAILASLNMAGKYVKMKRAFEEYKKNVDETILAVTEKLEKSIDE